MPFHKSTHHSILFVTLFFMKEFETELPISQKIIMVFRWTEKGLWNGLQKTASMRVLSGFSMPVSQFGHVVTLQSTQQPKEEI